MPSFKYVKVPANDAEPVEELEIEYDDDRIVQCLTESLQAYFRNIKGDKNDPELFRQQVYTPLLPCMYFPWCCVTFKMLFVSNVYNSRSILPAADRGADEEATAD